MLEIQKEKTEFGYKFTVFTDEGEFYIIFARNLDLYFEWNQLFMDINVSKCPPTNEFIKEMKLLRKKTEPWRA